MFSIFPYIFSTTFNAIAGNINRFDNIVDNAEFNGSEIIDRLEALISNPVDLGANNSDKLAIISDFQSLIEFIITYKLSRL